MTSNIRGSLICSPKSLYKKTSQEILAELKAAFRTGESKVPRPWPVLPSLLWQAYVNSQLSPTPTSPTRGREKKNVTINELFECNDRSPKWIINNCYIFFPYLQVWVFLFLQTSFFTSFFLKEKKISLNFIMGLGVHFHILNQCRMITHFWNM